MLNLFRVRLIIGLLGATGLWLGFPNPLVQCPVLVLLFPAALYILGLMSRSFWEAFRPAFLTGMVGAAAVLYWIALPVHDVGDLPWLLAVPCALLLGAYVGLYAGIFALCCRSIAAFPPIRRALAAGVIWFCVEWLRGVLFTGFPWMNLSAAFVPWPVFVQGASLVGTYGLSAFFVAMACLLAQSTPTDLPLRMRLTGFAVTGLLLLIISGFGVWRLNTDPLGCQRVDAQSEVQGQITQKWYTFAVIQGNIDQNQKWEVAYQRSTVDKYLDLSLKALSGDVRPDLLIWPETAMPFYVQNNPVHSPRLAFFAEKHRIPLLLGAPGFERGAGETLLFNRAFLINAQGRLAASYEKEHLVPFGEYAPPPFDFEFLEPLMQGVGSFTPGLAEAPVRWQNLALGMLICYESIFPELAQKRVNSGANILINISNDAWFGDSAAALQHMQLGVMRAVEQGRYIVRATNTGISALIDPYGRVEQRGGLFVAETFSFRAAIISEKTFFHRIYDWLGFIAVAVLCLLLCAKPSTYRIYHAASR